MDSVIVFLLIIIAVGLVLAAHLTETIQFGIAAVVASLAGVLLAAWRAMADRRMRSQETTPARVVDDEGDVPDQQPTGAETGDEGSAVLAEAEAADGGDSQDDEREPANSEEAAVSIGVVEGGVEIVCVVPGRKRFHEPGCSALAGRQSEELTREEAEEEGFTPCSLCCGSRRTIRKIG